ncbi:hypothetical protein P9G84_31205 [Brevibacillus centrosporus]|uniref:hypothetical protein n=1 Tax=Brevibacillus centrosporus TaxID=54910 RepID=UPI001142AAB0|nr:hypothetical protein [Brevibacillus centrosporus]MEC2133326.1 hypothetical protein [Brevibacillus centrosporus]GED33917.1 hypothetical protein BCE02nite_50580 [Brevibacillus centrosporus]
MKLLRGIFVVAILLQGCTNESAVSEERNNVVDVAENVQPIDPIVNKGSGVANVSTVSKQKDQITEAVASPLPVEKSVQPITQANQTEMPQDEPMENQNTFKKQNGPLVPRYQYKPQTNEATASEKTVAETSITEKTFKERLDEMIKSKQVMKEAEEKGYSIKLDSKGQVIVEDEPIIAKDQNGAFFFKDPNEEIQSFKTNP